MRKSSKQILKEIYLEKAINEPSIEEREEFDFNPSNIIYYRVDKLNSLGRLTEYFKGKQILEEYLHRILGMTNIKPEMQDMIDAEVNTYKRRFLEIAANCVEKETLSTLVDKLSAEGL